MTRSDIYDLIEIIEECKKEERKYAEGYIALNPEDAKSRNKIADDICTGINRVWNKINEKYCYLKN